MNTYNHHKMQRLLSISVCIMHFIWTTTLYCSVMRCVLVGCLMHCNFLCLFVVLVVFAHKMTSKSQWSRSIIALYGNAECVQCVPQHRRLKFHYYVFFRIQENFCKWFEWWKIFKVMYPSGTLGTTSKSNQHWHAILVSFSTVVAMNNANIFSTTLTTCWHTGHGSCTSDYNFLGDLMHNKDIETSKWHSKEKQWTWNEEIRISWLFWHSPWSDWGSMCTPISKVYYWNEHGGKFHCFGIIHMWNVYIKSWFLIRKIPHSWKSRCRNSTSNHTPIGSLLNNVPMFTICSLIFYSLSWAKLIAIYFIFYRK